MERYRSQSTGHSGRTLFVGKGIVFLLLSACASQSTKVQRETINDPNEPIQILSERVKDQDQKIEKLTYSIDDLVHQLHSLKKELASSMAPRVSKGASIAKDPSVPVEKLIPEGEVAANDEASASASDAAEDDKEVAVADSSQEDIHWYYEGMKHVKDEKYDDAIRSFRKFLEENPDHVYADRTEYWIAESYFRNKEYSLAVLSANGLESRHPYSLRLPDALMVKARSFRALGQINDAREALRQVMLRFPSVKIADSASRELAELSLETNHEGNRPPVLIDEPATP